MMSQSQLIVTGSPEATRSRLQSDNPEAEFIPLITETLTIGEVRRLIELAYQSPGEKSVRLLVVQSKQINLEAQQALLKILEEPPLSTRFILLLPSRAGLLPTVLSRLQVTDESGFVETDEFTQFIQSSIPQRLEYIATAAKQKEPLIFAQLVIGLVAYVDKKTVTPESLVVVNSALLQLQQKGAAKKMVWEELALTLPVESH